MRSDLPQYGRELTPQTTRRRGLTLLEVVVTIGIIGLLLAILLPAVQQSRGAARMTHCRSNLRQLALAANNYESLHGEFPHGNISDSYSVFVAILPQLDAAVTYQKVGFVVTSGSKPNTVLNKRPEVLACPTDPVVWRDLVRLSYNGNSGWTATWIDLFQGNSSGIFVGSPTNGPRAKVSASAIRDGLSHTAIFSEAIAGGETDRRRCVWSDANVWQPLSQDALSSRCEQATTITDPCVLRCALWTWARDNVTLYHHVSTPNKRSCNFVPTAGSFHSGGVNVAYCDGSSRFISDSIGAAVWRAMGTRAGSETIGY